MSVEFNYFGKTRHLKFDLDAIKYIERKTGLSIMALMKEEKLGIDVLTIMLSACLIKEDQSMTPEKVTRWIEKYIMDNDSNLIELIGPFTNAILLAIQESRLFGSFGKEVNNDFEGNLMAGEE